MALSGSFILDRGARCAAAAALLPLLLLTACGGSGGGTPVTPLPPGDVAQINSSLLESKPQDVKAYSAGIDDSGRTTVVFLQSNGTREELMAVTGTPGARGGASSFSAPVVIDGQSNIDAAAQFAVAMSPNGHAVAMWTVTAPCTASTYNTTGNCRYVYSARKLVDGAWEAPVLVSDTPFALTSPLINRAGDITISWSGWERTGPGTYKPATGAMWKANGQSGFTGQLFSQVVPPTGSTSRLTLDSAGNMVLVTPSVSTTGNVIAAARGNVSSGFTVLDRLDTEPASASLEGMAGGLNGQVVVLWQQAVGGQNMRWAATLDGPSQSWAVSQLGVPAASSLAGRNRGAVNDAGDFTRYDLENCRVQRRVSQVWQTETALDATLCSSSDRYLTAMSRGGDLVGGLISPSAGNGNTGQWLYYSASEGKVLQPFSTQGSGNGYFFGVANQAGGLLFLSESRVASFITANAYDVLPSVAVPSGASGSATNIWALYLKIL